MKKDILIFLSDQHRKDYIGKFNPNLHTPNLDQLIDNGTTFTSCYTACPLCVPARVAFISCQSASHTKIYSNSGAIRNDVATFLHALSANGYETVLCGRMHFEGENQRFGFTKRIFGDLTQLYPGQSDTYHELAHYRPTISEKGCMTIYGGGEHSPTLDYDRHVIHRAIEYLGEEHEKPQCLVIGTYAPHFPYVSPTQLYKKYLEKLSKSDDHNYNYKLSVLKERYTQKSNEENLKIRAAYCGMIENLDSQIGDVYKAWKTYLDKKHSEGLFIYTSDHGDQLGERDLYAKKTLFENSAGVPLIIEGSDIIKGYRNNTPVSLMDIGITLCDMTDSDIPYGVEGKSFLPQLKQEDVGERYVVSETIEKVNDTFVPAIMVRKGKYKYITYYGYEEEALLFDLEMDPKETTNVIHKHRDIKKELEDMVHNNWHPETIIRDHIERIEHAKLLEKWGKEVVPKEVERWRITKEALTLPDMC